MAKKRKNPPKSDPAPTTTSAAAASTVTEQQPDPQIKQDEQLKEEEIEIKSQEKKEEQDDAMIKVESFQFDDDEEDGDGDGDGDGEGEGEGEGEEDDEVSQKEKDGNAPNGETAIIKKGEDDGDENEPVQKLLEPFTKDQLIEILTQAAESHADVLDQIRKLSDTDPVHRKIFVHGLGWDTTSESLTEVFKQYGEIEDCNCVTDKVTGKSKGYAFILYKHRSGARKALKEPQKKIGNRMTACQLASAGPVPAQAHHAPAAAAAVVPATPASEYTQRKIYVSNVGPEIDPQKLVPFFSKFGEIEEGPLGLDKHTGKPKGFALFVYRSIESAKKALEEPHKNFEGTILHCQKAIDGPKPNKPNYNQSGSSGGRPSKYQRTDNSAYAGGHLSSGASSAGHLMAQTGHGMGYNQGAAPAINPLVGQALTALLASQGGGGLGLTNLLGTLGTGGVGANMNPVGQPLSGGYGSQYGASGYGSQTGAQGGYYSQAGQGSGGRSQKGGYMGGANPYMGH